VREAIAEQRVIFESPGGVRRAGLIRIEKPYEVDETEARCPVVIDGLQERMPDVSGTSTLQALALAVWLCSSLLRDFVEAGGRILRPDTEGGTQGEEVLDLEDCLGPLGAASHAPRSRPRAAGSRRA
jgi:hypothetical protein